MASKVAVCSVQWLRRWACPGYRHPYTGALTNVGNNGYNWSSAVSGTNGMNLGFHSSWLNPSNTNNRANGFQVRCLQAFINVLIHCRTRGRINKGRVSAGVSCGYGGRAE